MNSDLRRMRCLKVVLGLAILAGMAVSPKLWTTDRAFPTVPLYPWIPDLPQTVCLPLAWILAFSVAAMALHPRPAKLASISVGLVLGLIVFDVNRLQPWLVEYLPMLNAICFVDWDDGDSRRSKAAWAVCATVVISIYFWSGLQKFNATFAEQVFPWLLHPFGLSVTEWLRPWWPVAPLVEAGIGLLLLLPKSRSLGVGIAVAMHTLLLFLLGPWGQNYDSIVWPWNAATATTTIVLFGRNEASVLRSVWTSSWGKASVVVFGILPVLNFFNLWDGFLSASFYSGKLRDGWIYLTENGARQLPRRYVEGNEGFAKETANRYRLDLLRWSMSRLNAPPYAEPRFYAGVVRKLEQAGVSPREMTLLVRDPARLNENVESVSPYPER